MLQTMTAKSTDSFKDGVQRDQNQRWEVQSESDSSWILESSAYNGRTEAGSRQEQCVVEHEATDWCRRSATHPGSSQLSVHVPEQSHWRMWAPTSITRIPHEFGHMFIMPCTFERIKYSLRSSADSIATKWRLLYMYTVLFDASGLGPAPMQTGKSIAYASRALTSTEQNLHRSRRSCLLYISIWDEEIPPA